MLGLWYAALASIARYYGSNYSLALESLQRARRQRRTTALELSKASKEMGFETDNPSRYDIV